MRSTQRIRTGLAVMACLYLNSTTFAVAQYAITDLGTLGGTGSDAWGINDNGQVVGQSQTKDGSWHAFVWDKSHGMTDIGAFGGSSSVASKINNHGQVTGWYYKNGIDTPFFYDPLLGKIDIGSSGRGYAHSLNDSGQVVGWYGTGNNLQAFVWDSTNGMRYWGNASFASGINNTGQIVGSNFSRALLWNSTTGETTDVGAVGGNGGDRVSINSLGQVSFYSSNGHVLIWDGVTTPADLGVGHPYSINDFGVVVGIRSDNYGWRACLFDQINGRQDLQGLISPTSGWTRLEYAMDIGNNGQIVGSGYINGYSHAYLMEPIPEPTTLLLVGLGGLMLKRQTR